jgi:hypothetical protein
VKSPGAGLGGVGELEIPFHPALQIKSAVSCFKHHHHHYGHHQSLMTTSLKFKKTFAFPSKKKKIPHPHCRPFMVE